MFACNTITASVNITANGGWFESAYAEWKQMDGASSYNVYYKSAGSSEYTKIDNQLVRNYGSYGRADVVGIKEGSYVLRIVPVNADGQEMTADASETETLSVAAHDRGGFAHFRSANSSFDPAVGIGAYKNDGTLKEGAKVIYVHAGNAKTITTDVITSSKGGKTTCTGFQGIIDAYQKGYDKTPIDFRIIGTIKAGDMDEFSSSAEGLQIKGKDSYSELNITIEGIGNDATIHGFGFLLRNACSVELRNFAIMWFMDDAVSMDTDNSNLWVHNLDLFYGQPGGDSDQKKGDGTLDIKGDSRYSTLSYNHLWDSGKASLCGMTSETGPNYITYHHNWFDHSDSRHPRIRTMSVHVYNNYYDGNSKYGVGSTTGSNVFVENNYFRACKYPMLISKQGSDVHNGVGTSDDTKGTFSGEEGGMIKAFGNYMTGQKSFEAWTETGTYNKHFDAYVASSRDEKVPEGITSLLGNNAYSNFDTDPALFYSGYTCHEAEDVKDIVTGKYGAGRCQHGDFKWTFTTADDASDKIVEELSSALQKYSTTLVGLYNEEIKGTDTPGGGDDDDDPSGDTSKGTILTFEGEHAGCPFFTVEGNTSNSKGTATYKGVTYSICLKMESATSITFTAPTAGKLILVYGSGDSKMNIKLDGTKITDGLSGNVMTINGVAAGKHTLTKADSCNLFYIEFVGDGTNGIDDIIMQNATRQPIYSLSGKRISQPQPGQTVIINGKKVVVK